jgi:hypothetical protein
MAVDIQVLRADVEPRALGLDGELPWRRLLAQVIGVVGHGINDDIGR